MAETKKEDVDLDNQQENAVDSEEKEESETCFEDLPDDAIMHIMTDLDFASFLKLRLNKRLNRLQLSVKKEFSHIIINIASNWYSIYVEHSNTRASFDSNDFEQLSQGLRRLALNTRVGCISMTIHHIPIEENCRVVEALLSFEATECRFASATVRLDPSWYVRHLNRSSIHDITQNLEKFHCDGLVCSSITVQDLCIIRKAMLEDGCKLRWFTMRVEQEMEKSFLETCFGMTIDDFAGPLSGRIYRAADDSLEIYSLRPPLSAGGYNKFSHWEGDFFTILWFDGTEYNISFSKCDKQETRDFAEMKRYALKVQLNHFYRMQ